MLNILHLLSLISLAAAVKIDFMRFDDDHCAKEHHIRKVTHLHSPHCKTFTHHEVPFTSFKYKLTGHVHDVNDKECKVIAFTEKDCEGHGTEYALSHKDNEECLTLPQGIEGRSVRLTCNKKEPEVKTVNKPVTKVIAAPTTTITHTHEPENYPTMTLVPKPHAHRVKVCHWEDEGDDDDWKQ